MCYKLACANYGWYNGGQLKMRDRRAELQIPIALGDYASKGELNLVRPTYVK